MENNKRNKNITASHNKKDQNIIYRNNSELTNKNSYMIYELNNTFNDKETEALDEIEGRKNIK